MHRHFVSRFSVRLPASRKFFKKSGVITIRFFVGYQTHISGNFRSIRFFRKRNHRIHRVKRIRSCSVIDIRRNAFFSGFGSMQQAQRLLNGKNDILRKNRFGPHGQFQTQNLFIALTNSLSGQIFPIGAFSTGVLKKLGLFDLFSMFFNVCLRLLSFFAKN